jgi:hypothetical protein
LNAFIKSCKTAKLCIFKKNISFSFFEWHTAENMAKESFSQTSKSGHFLMVQLGLVLIVIISLLQKGFDPIGLNNHSGNLSKHRKKFIIIVITNLLRSNSFNTCKNNMNDKTNLILNRKSKICSPLLEFHEDYRLLTRISYE